MSGGRSGVPVVVALVLLACAVRPSVALADWQRANSLPEPRRNHIAIWVPDAGVLVAGGNSSNPNPAYLNTSWLAPPGTAGWVDAGLMAEPRHWHTVALMPDGQPVVTGGYTGSSAAVSAERWDVAARTWVDAGSMSVSRDRHDATVLGDGTMMVSGRGGGALASAERYSHLTGVFTPLPVMITGRRAHHGLMLVGGDLLLAGGSASTGASLTQTERLSMLDGTWQARAPLNIARQQYSAVRLLDGRVLLTGGADSTNTLSSAEVYDPVANTWTPIAPMAVSRASHCSAVLPDGTVLVVGGISGTHNGGTVPQFTGTYLASTELYDPALNTWTDAGRLAEARAASACVQLPRGDLWVTGGYNLSGQLASVEVYVFTGQAPDGGSVDGGGVDGGVPDAGSSGTPSNGSADDGGGGGSEGGALLRREFTVGCACTHWPTTSTFLCGALAALTLRRRRGVRQAPPSKLPGS